ncbi:gluconate 2-dehydrogenase subunit 3 family protein [Glaciecola siphonariae]|uniref:Gluconate 2-dehydrogenase subunit 3 family protein n=1 Tax=Glaciecola siphonariae TaxID=521012 RepID=A0ABV9LSF9_9ALTE
MIKSLAISLGLTLSKSAFTRLVTLTNYDADANSRDFVNGQKTASLLSNKQKRLLKTLADIVLPVSDSPSASEVGADHFVEYAVNQLFSEDDQEHFLKGLMTFDNMYTAFIMSDGPTQKNIITHIDGDAFKPANSENPSDILRFYTLFKQCLLLGYFTSESVMTGFLNYHPVPGRYDPKVIVNESSLLFVTN